jgi:type I restriction enzyme S subunit
VNFIKHSVSFKGFRYKLELISPGGAGRNRVLNQNDFLRLKLSVPETVMEQTVIGDFFRNLNERIADQQTKVISLKQLKSAYLQRMFV